MRPQEQIITIAEASGWKGIRGSNHPVGSEGINPSTGVLEHLPDYLNDLDAMHEAEKTLDSLGKSARQDYAEHLGRGCQILLPTQGVTRMGVFIVSHSTAAQRAEAFLKAIGKWKI